MCALAYVAYWQYQYSRAEGEAQRFCDAAAPGSDVSEAVARAGGLKDVHHGYVDGGTRYIAVFRGPIFNAFVCELDLAAGRVTDRRVKPPDD